jgi:O-antigen/teichoic acid export membrane protein
VSGESGLLEVFRLSPFDGSTPEGRARERQRRVALTALLSSVSKGVAIATGLLAVPLTINYLGVERYGLWMTVSSLITLFAFADLGIGNGLVSEVASAQALGDVRQAAEAVSSAFLVLGIVSLLGAALFGAVYSEVSWPGLFNVSSATAVREAGPALAVFVWCFLVNVPLGIVQRIQMGCQEGYVSALWSALGQIGALLAVIAAIRYEGGLPALILAMSGVPILVTAASAVYLFGRQHRDLRPRWALASWATALRIVGTGGWFLLLQIIAAFHYSADNLIIARLLGPSEVSRYAVGMRLALVCPMITGMWLMPLWPAISEAVARDDWLWVRRTFKRAFVWSTVFNFVGAIVLTTIGDAIAHVWIGRDINLGFGLLGGFGLFTLAAGISGPVAMFMNGMGIIKIQTVTCVLMAVVSLWARIHFAPAYGVTGVILSNAASQIALVSLPSLWILSRAIRPALDEASEASRRAATSETC